MERPQFDTSHPDFTVVRQVVLQRLRSDPSWRHLDQAGEGFLPFVTLSPLRPNDRSEFAFFAMDVFWQLVVEGVLAPGLNAQNPNLPHFHITAYGKVALAEDDFQPHDRTGYLARVNSRVQPADPTVIVYLEESLETFVRGNLVASMVMLGVAAERVFNLLCESLEAALATPDERTAFSRLLERNSMKPKLDWVHEKLRAVQEQRRRPKGFPENAVLMSTAIYDLIRIQRNDLGHPRDVPPRLSRGDAHANLQIFPRYYETAEAVRRFLAVHPV